MDTAQKKLKLKVLLNAEFYSPKSDVMSVIVPTDGKMAFLLKTILAVKLSLC